MQEWMQESSRVQRGVDGQDCFNNIDLISWHLGMSKSHVPWNSTLFRFLQIKWAPLKSETPVELFQHSKSFL